MADQADPELKNDEEMTSASIQNLLDDVNALEEIDFDEVSDDEDSLGLRKSSDPYAPNLQGGPKLTDLPDEFDMNFVLLSEEKNSMQSKLQETQEQLSKKEFEYQQLASEKQKVEEQKKEVEEQKKALRKKLASSPRGDDDLDREELVDRFSQSRQEIAALKKRIVELEHEVRTKDSKQQAVALKIDRKHKKEVEGLQKKVRKLSDDLEAAKNDLLDKETDLEIANGEIEELEEKVEAFKNLYDETRESLMSSQTENTDEMTRMLEEHMKRQAELSAEREDIENQYKELERRHKELEQRDSVQTVQISERSDQIKELEEQLLISKAQNEKLIESFEKMLEEKKQMKEQIAILEDQMMSLHESTEFLRMENESLNKDLAAKSQEDLQVQGFLIKDLEAQKDELQLKIDQLATEIKRLKDEATLKDTETQEFGDMIQELQSENKSILAQNSELKIKLSRLKEIDNLKFELGNKTKLVNQIQEELVSIKEQYETAVASKLSLICNISNNMDSMREDLIAYHKLQATSTPRTVIQQESFTDWITSWLITAVS